MNLVLPKIWLSKFKPHMINMLMKLYESLNQNLKASSPNIIISLLYSHGKSLRESL